MKKPPSRYSALATLPPKQIQLIERRLFLRHSLSLGALALLTGCDVTDVDAVQKTLWAMSKWNDRVQ
ncbi:MAG: molybdopterin-binding protein, partial [Bacteroidota bacterium]